MYAVSQRADGAHQLDDDHHELGEFRSARLRSERVHVPLLRVLLWFHVDRDAHRSRWKHGCHQVT